MITEIESINTIILPDARAGKSRMFDESIDDNGEKARVIREWIPRVLSKMVYYKLEHDQILNEAAFVYFSISCQTIL